MIRTQMHRITCHMPPVINSDYRHSKLAAENPISSVPDPICIPGALRGGGDHEVLVEISSGDGNVALHAP